MWRLVYGRRSGGSGVSFRREAAGQEETSHQSDKYCFASRGDFHASEARQFQFALSSLPRGACWSKLNKHRGRHGRRYSITASNKWPRRSHGSSRYPRNRESISWRPKGCEYLHHCAVVRVMRGQGPCKILADFPEIRNFLQIEQLGHPARISAISHGPFVCSQDFAPRRTKSVRLRFHYAESSVVGEFKNGLLTDRRNDRGISAYANLLFRSHHLFGGIFVSAKPA